MRVKGKESKFRVKGKIETEPHRNGVRGKGRRSRISICLLDLAARLETETTGLQLALVSFGLFFHV